MKTAVYVRVSTEEQAKEGYSIRGQIDKLKSYIQIKDWEFYKVYADEGLSGKNIDERPALGELINDIKNGKVNNVLVYKIDRLTRSIRDLITLNDIFQEYNCGFNSIMENIDTRTASGRMFLKLLGIFAEFERENLIERITLACEKKVKEGYSLTYFIQSYGYYRNKGEKVQQINQEEAKIVKEIFEMYVNGNLTYNAIARNLNNREIKTKKGTTWNDSSIRNILQNPTYIGKVRYSLKDEKRYFEAEGKHQPIIDEELFYQAQNKIGKIKRKSRTKRPKEDHYFSGTLYCGLCGEKLQTHGMYTKNKNGEVDVNAGYRCPNVNKGLCNTSRFAQIKLELAFQEYINDIVDINNPDEIITAEENKQEQINNLLKEEYENALLKLDKREKDVMKLYINERINFEEYEEMTKLLKQEKNTYQAQLTKIPGKSNEEIKLAISDIITNFKENWLLLNNMEKQQFVQSYIDKITAVSTKEQGYKVKILKVDFYSN